MKKLLTLFIAVTMLLAMSQAVFAAPSDLSGVIADLGKTPPITRSLEVPVNMQVDVDGAGTYVDGPVTKSTSSASNEVDFKATIYMSEVRALYQTLMSAAELYVAGESELEARVANSVITGEFIVKITYPSTAVIPTAVTSGAYLSGFNSAAANAFVESAPRTVATVDGGNKELTITLSVKENLKASEMSANLETYLPDITFTCEGIKLATGTNKVVGTITGQTDIYDVNEDPDPDDLICAISYTGKQGTDEGVTGDEISETVTFNYSSGGITVTPGTGGGSVTTKPGTTEKAKVTLVVGGLAEDIELEADKKGNINIDDIAAKMADTRPGFVVKGIYDSETGGNKLEGDVKFDKDTTIHVQWINVTVPEALEGDNHIKYIEGYPDGTARPEDNITREEIATIFYRLLKEDVRAEILTAENSFTDVEADRWSNEAVSTIAKGGYISGYADGTFRPEANITRAELAAIAARFLSAPAEGKKDFTDIDGHWAEEYILSIANSEWIYGDGDGSFRPDDYITRAEAITIINRILVRYVNDHGLTGTEKQWPDNAKDAWYYHAVIEATNAHDHTRAENGYHENWNTAE